MSTADTPILSDLTLPRADTRTLRSLINRQSRDLLRQLLSIPPGVIRPELAGLHREAVAVYRRVMAEEPRLLVRILRQPSHSALLVLMSRQLHGRGDLPALNRWLAELHLLTLLELAASGGLKESVDVVRANLPQGKWPVLRIAVAKLELTLAASVVGIRVTPQGIILGLTAQENVAIPFDAPEATTPYATLRRPWFSVDGNILLAATDNNPLSDFEAHPDKSGNSVDLGDKPASQWVDSLRGCFALVDEFLPLVAEEMRLILRSLVPVGWHDEKHLSASYQEAVGTIYLTLHPNLMTMAEALVHEFQHNKLNMAFNIDPLLENGFSPLYTSPVRPDPRPLHGVILAVHAFQAVASLYEKMLEAGHPYSQNPHWIERFRTILALIDSGGSTVLEHAKPTAMGAPFFSEMRELHTYFRSYAAKMWPTEPAVAVRDLG